LRVNKKNRQAAIFKEILLYLVPEKRKLTLMFSVEYYNRVVIITAYNIRRINTIYIEKLRKLILQSMKQSCKKIIINMVGVRLINPGAIETLKLLSGIAGNIGIKLVLINVDAELQNQISTYDDKKLIGICTLMEISELASFSG